MCHDFVEQCIYIYILRYVYIYMQDVFPMYVNTSLIHIYIGFGFDGGVCSKQRISGSLFFLSCMANNDQLGAPLHEYMYMYVSISRCVYEWLICMYVGLFAYVSSIFVHV